MHTRGPAPGSVLRVGADTRALWAAACSPTALRSSAATAEPSTPHQRRHVHPIVRHCLFGSPRGGQHSLSESTPHKWTDGHKGHMCPGTPRQSQGPTALCARVNRLGEAWTVTDGPRSVVPTADRGTLRAEGGLVGMARSVHTHTHTTPLAQLVLGPPRGTAAPQPRVWCPPRTLSAARMDRARVDSAAGAPEECSNPGSERP